MPRNLYLAGIAAVALGAAVLMLLDGGGQSFFASLLIDTGPNRVDRLQVGSPAAPGLD